MFKVISAVFPNKDQAKDIHIYLRTNTWCELCYKERSLVQNNIWTIKVSFLIPLTSSDLQGDFTYCKPFPIWSLVYLHSTSAAEDDSFMDCQYRVSFNVKLTRS